jgi:hypothetical protein
MTTNTIKTTVKLEYLETNSVKFLNPSQSFSVLTTSEILSVNTQLVGVAHEVIALGDVTDDAFVMIENKHATALVQVGVDVAASFVGVIDIPAGGPPAILPRATTLATTYLISSVASTPVRITLIKVVAP